MKSGIEVGSSRRKLTNVVVVYEFEGKRYRSSFRSGSLEKALDAFKVENPQVKAVSVEESEVR